MIFNSKIFDQSKDKDYDLSQQTLEFDNDFHRIEVKSNADIDVSTHELDKIIVTYTTTDETQKLDVDYMNHVLKLGKVKMEKFFQKASSNQFLSKSHKTVIWDWILPQQVEM